MGQVHELRHPKLEIGVDGETFEASGTLPVRIQPAALTIAGAIPARFQ